MLTIERSDGSAFAAQNDLVIYDFNLAEVYRANVAPIDAPMTRNPTSDNAFHANADSTQNTNEPPAPQLLFGITGTDWRTYAMVAALIVLASMLAAFLPARWRPWPAAPR